jgi:hypothetical protein
MTFIQRPPKTMYTKRWFNFVEQMIVILNQSASENFNKVFFVLKQRFFPFVLVCHWLSLPAEGRRFRAAPRSQTPNSEFLVNGFQTL